MPVATSMYEYSRITAVTMEVGWRFVGVQERYTGTCLSQEADDTDSKKSWYVSHILVNVAAWL